MTAPDEKAREIVTPLLYQQKGPIDAFALQAAIAAALIEARSEGAAQNPDCPHRYAIDGRCLDYDEDLPMWHALTPEALMAAYDAEILSRGIPPTDIPEYRAARLSLCAGTLARLKL